MAVPVSSPFERAQYQTDCAMAISGAVLVISAIAFAIIFKAAYPPETFASSLFFYGALSLVSAGFIAFAVSSAVKIYRHNCLELPPPLERHSYRTYQDLIGAHWEDLSTPDQTQLPLSIKKSWPVRVSPEVVIHDNGHNISETVFELEQAEGLLFKKSSHFQAERTYHKMVASSTLAVDSGLKHCRVPKCELIVPETHPEQGILVIEKLPKAFSQLTIREKSEQLYDQFPENPGLEAKWRDYFREATSFICLTGFSAVDWKGMALLDKGFAFLDFTFTSKEELPNSLKRLALMAPPQFYSTISETAKVHGIAWDEGASKVELDAANQERLMRSQARSGHREKGIKGGEEIPLDKWDPDSPEGKIITTANKRIAAQAVESEREGIVVDIRTVLFITPNEEALQKLKDEKILFGWLSKPSSVGRIPLTYVYF